MADNNQHVFANDGSDWKTPPGPVDNDEARKADAKVDKAAARGSGPSATNEVKLGGSVLANDPK